VVVINLRADAPGADPVYLGLTLGVQRVLVRRRARALAPA
jgi:hypothetical protein